jgi:hypothetical protein
MRYFALFLCAILFLNFTIIYAGDGKVNFSGEWTLDKDKSDLGDSSGRRRGRAASKLIIEQEDNKIIVESFRQNRDGEEVSTKLTYTFDGKKIKNEMRFGDQVSTAKWSGDGKTLTIESTMTMSRGDRDITIESTNNWCLDGELLTIGSTRITPRGERKSNAVYTKASYKK